MSRGPVGTVEIAKCFHPYAPHIKMFAVDASQWRRWLKKNHLAQFVIIVAEDTIELAVVWVFLFLFHFLPEYMPVHGFAALLIDDIHQIGSVVVAALLVFFLVIDVVQAKRRR